MPAAIRDFRFPDDFDNVIALWSTAGDGIHLGRSDSYGEIRKKAEHDPELFLVAEHDGKIVGSVIGGFDGRRGIVYHLAVAQELRGEGLGGRLMDEVEGRLREKGCLRVYLLVTNENETAIRFYEKRGWNEMNMHIYAKDIA